MFSIDVGCSWYFASAMARGIFGADSSFGVKWRTAGKA